MQASEPRLLEITFSKMAYLDNPEVASSYFFQIYA